MKPSAGWYADTTGRHRLRYWDGHEWTTQAVDVDPLAVPPGTAPCETGAGWAYDPTGRYGLRYFDGTAWTSDVMLDEAGASVMARPEPPSPVAVTAPARTRAAGIRTREQLDFVLAFLGRARASGHVDRPTYEALVRDARVEQYEAQSRERVERAPTARPAAPVVVHPARVAPKVAKPPVAVEEPPSWGEEVREWLAQAAQTARSDLAVHGLAYLGVALLFVGLLGFVVFAFGDVSTSLRPVAELLIPVAVFGAAWLLDRRGSRAVGSALVVLGGALVPVVVIASFVDGAGAPPDLHGGELEAVLTAAMVVVAGAYAAYATRHHQSPLRFMVGPLVWVAVAMAARATDPAFSGGRDVARPQAWQMAITAGAIALSALATRRWRGGVLADATDAVILPGLGIVVVLEALAVAAHGWTPGPTVATGLAALVVFELEASRLGVIATTALQAVSLGAVVAAIGPDAGWAWAAAAAVPAFLLIGEWWMVRRRCELTVLLTLLPVGIGLLSCWDLPWPPVLAFGVASAWAHARRLRPGPWRVVRLDVLAAALPLGLAAACFIAFPNGVGAVVLAAALAAGVVVVRSTSARDDPFWSRWVPLAAVVLLAGIVAELARVGPVLPACAAALVGFAAVVSTGPVPARVWIAAAAWAIAAALACDASGIALGVAALAFAVVGVALVAVPLRFRGSAVGHVALVGHLTTVGAAVAAATAGGWTAVGALALCTAGWVVTTAAQETRGSPAVDALGRVLPHEAPAVPASLAFLLLPLTAWAALVEAGALTRGSVWTPVVPAAFALFDAALARAAHDRVRLATIAAWVGFLLVAGATVAAGAIAGPDDSAVVALTAGIAVAVVAVIPIARRQYVMPWVGWAESGVVVVWGSLAAGVASEHVQVSLLAWGAALTVYALAFDARTVGPRARGQFLRDDRFAPPLVLGVAGVIVAVGRAVALGPGSLGWWALALAGLTLVWALELHEPWILYASCSFGAAAAALLLPWRPPDAPWGLLVSAIALELAAEVVTRIRARDRAGPWDPWAVPPFVVANGVAVATLACAEAASTPSAVYLAVGAWSLVVAWSRRAWPWAVVGVALVDVGAGRASAGWLALALAGTAVVATLAAIRARGIARLGLQISGAAAAGGAWVAGASWLGLTREHSVTISAIVAGVLVFGAASALRACVVGRDWATVWAGLGVVGLSLDGLFASELDSRTAGLAVACGVALASGACAIAAAPLGVGWLREAAACLLVAAGGIAAVSAELGAGEIVAVASGVGIASVVAASSLAARRPASRWLRPAVLLAGLASAIAIVAACTELPGRELLVPALALTGVEVAVLGVVLRRFELLAASPVLFCASWLAFASEALTGEPQWFTVPIGITVLVVEAFVGAAIRARGGPRSTAALHAVDYTGMAFVVGAALAQTVVEGPVYGLIGAGLGAALVAWGAVTRVRRRAIFGASTVALSLLLMLAVPLAELVPRLEGAAMWATVAALGLVAIVIAALLEQGRRGVHATVARIEELTHDWE